MVVNFFKPFYLTLIQLIFLVTLRMSTMLNVIYFTVKSHKDGRKQHTCKYCQKKVFKIPRHLEDCHEDITEVAHALAYPQKSKERRAAFAKIRREGDYEPSVERLKSKEKAFAVRKGKPDNELSPCPNCYGFFRAKFLYKHSKHCPANVLSHERSTQLHCNILKSSRSLLATAIVDDKNHHTIVNEVVAKMTQDTYALIIKTDKLLLTYGAAMFEKDGPKRRSEISYKLKSLAKLLEVFQGETKNESSNAFDLIDPRNWDTLVASAKVLTKYDNNRVGTPSLFLKLGYSLQHMARVARAIASKAEDEVLLKKSKSFLELYESEWTVYSTRI